MKLLLHVCCAPCAIEMIKYLREELNAEIVAFNYNPNIQPRREYFKRWQSLKKFCQLAEIKLIDLPYFPQDFFSLISIYEKIPQRCYKCWQLRLEKTAIWALENDFEYFSTTLLTSPYQDLKKLQEIGERISQRVGVKFYFKNLRFLFPSSHKKAKELALYCQNYCGCIMSKREREEKLKQKSSVAS